MRLASDYKWLSLGQVPVVSLYIGLRSPMTRVFFYLSFVNIFFHWDVAPYPFTRTHTHTHTYTHTHTHTHTHTLVILLTVARRFLCCSTSLFMRWCFCFYYYCYYIIIILSLFLVSPSFSASGRVRFVSMAFPEYPLIFLKTGNRQGLHCRMHYI